MPFRYVKDAQGEPIMPRVSSGLPLRPRICTNRVFQGMVDLIKNDADKAVDDLF
jgi:hypothetical protein